MIFNAIISAIATNKSSTKKRQSLRNRYIIEKYQERSITNRYFK